MRYDNKRTTVPGLIYMNRHSTITHTHTQCIDFHYNSTRQQQQEEEEKTWMQKNYSDIN